MKSHIVVKISGEIAVPLENTERKAVLAGFEAADKLVKELREMNEWAQRHMDLKISDPVMVNRRVTAEPTNGGA